MDYFQDGQRERKKEKKKGTESLGKKPQKKPPQKFYVRLSERFSPYTNENPPRADGLDGLPARQKGNKNKKRGYPVLTGISSLT